MTASKQYKKDRLYIVIRFKNPLKNNEWDAKSYVTELTKNDLETKQEKERKRILNEFILNFNQNYFTLKIEEKTNETEAKKTLVSELMQIWINKKKIKVKESTLYGYKCTVDKHINKYFKDTYIQDIKKYHIQEFLDRMCEEGLNAGTIKKLKTYIQEAFNLAVDRELIISNLCFGTKIEKEKEAVDIEYFTEEELKKILEVSKGSRLETLIHLCSLYGLRRSEALGLTWSCIDFENKTMFIKATRTKIDSYKKRTKNKTSYRELPLMKRTIEHLTKLKEEQENYKKICKKDYISNDFVCKYPNGALFNINETTASFKRLLKKNSIKVLGIHALRHTFAYLAIFNKKLNVADVMKLMGHASIKTTMSYVEKINLEDKRKAMNILEDLAS